jgi:four helix bundle protein
MQCAWAMTPQELRNRTAAFARAIVTFCLPLLKRAETADTARQLLRSGTAVDSNYRSAQCGRSHDEFTARIGQVLDDATEARGWLELLHDTRLVTNASLTCLLDEARQLTKIFAKSYRTAKLEQQRRRRERPRPPRRPDR